ncbi:MAG: sugar kinase [Acidobacteria bacterium]|nr:sugar kinase [Acidobacteriota bacterium]
MTILVVGSVAFDSIRTPAGSRDEILGGSATYFSVAASYFSKVSLVAVVGEDFPESHVAFLRRKGVDTSGLQREKGRTFRWTGEYGRDLNTAKTLETQLNVFASFSPRIRPEHRKLPMVVLGNIDPTLQRSVLEQMDGPQTVVCDTMNYWIERTRESLLQTLARVDILLVNDAEVRQLAEDSNLLQAAGKVRKLGPQTLVVKRGEAGALMFHGNSVFVTPAFPVSDVVDPTGAGDSFAGGFCGYLAAARARDEAALRRAVVFGSVMASFTVSDFGPGRLGELTFTEIEERFREFRRSTSFEDPDRAGPGG